MDAKTYKNNARDKKLSFKHWGFLFEKCFGF
jgi:hypothetical protein